MAQPIGTLGNVETLTIDGRTFVNLSSLIILQGWTSVNSHSVLRKAGASSGYAVTSGKTLTIDAFKILNGAATGLLALATLCQCDVDIGMDVATAFTNAVNMTSSSLSFPFFGATVSTTIPSPMSQGFGGIGFSVAATKFVGAIMQTASVMIWAYGYES